jgi:hypothetical protein
VQRFGEIVSDALDAEDPLSSLLELLAELNHHDPSWYLISTKYTLHAIRNPDTAKVLAEHDKQLRDELTELLRLLLKKPGHKTDVDLDMVARVTVAIHEGGLAQTLVEQDALASGVRSSGPTCPPCCALFSATANALVSPPKSADAWRPDPETQARCRPRVRSCEQFRLAPPSRKGQRV